MNLNMIKHKNETKKLLLTLTKDCETLINQIHTKAEETFEYKMIQSEQKFDFKPPIPTEVSWMIGITDLSAFLFLT